MIETIKNANKILVVGHVRPDGDCIGAGLCVQHCCALLGKKADFVFDSVKPETYEFMPEYDRVNEKTLDDYDTVIAVDCADIKRMGSYGAMLEGRKSVCVDHHHTNDGFANLNIIDGKACSTCEMLYEMLEPHGLVDKTAATCLYVGLSTDTGHFMHQNTDSRAFTVAAGLASKGIDVGALNNSLYKSVSKNKMQLKIRALQSLTYHCDGKVAVMTISLKDLDECDCKVSDTEGLIDYATSVKGVVVSICLCEQTGNFRVSLRSKAPNVSAVAAKFGGGGHVLASGCILSGSYTSVVSRLLEAVAQIV